MLEIRQRYSNRRIFLDVLILPPGYQGAMESVPAKALVDTGASCSAISKEIVSDLNLQPYAKRLIKFGSGERLMDSHLFRVGFAEQNSDDIAAVPQIHVLDEVDGFKLEAAQNFQVLLGMDVLERCDTHISSDGEFRLTYKD